MPEAERQRTLEEIQTTMTAQLANLNDQLAAFPSEKELLSHEGVSDEKISKLEALLTRTLEWQTAFCKFVSDKLAASSTDGGGNSGAQQMTPDEEMAWMHRYAKMQVDCARDGFALVRALQDEARASEVVRNLAEALRVEAMHMSRGLNQG